MPQRKKRYNNHGGSSSSSNFNPQRLHHYHGVKKHHQPKGQNERRVYISPHLIHEEFDENLEANDSSSNQSRLSKKDKKIFKKFNNLVVAKERPKKLAIGDDDTETKKQLPTPTLHCKLSGVPQDVFDVIVKFLQDYFTCYDSNRDGLLAAYNPKVFFSLSLNSSNSNAYRSFKFDDYIKESRNLKRLFASDDYYYDKRYKLLHQGHIDTVNTLRKLPPSEHDPSSFRLDHCFFTPHMITFTVVGTFKEGKETDKVRPLRSFERIFVCIPSASTCMSIINEQYMIANISNQHYKNFYREKERAAFTSKDKISGGGISNGSTIKFDETSILVSDPSAALLPADLTDVQQQLIQRFSAESRLNLKWSHDCLQQAGWNFDSAGQMFLEYKDKIPIDAFLS